MNIHISICQFKITDNKKENISKAKYYIEKAPSKSSFIVLPECFVCPYDINLFEENAEFLKDNDDSPTVKMLIQASKMKLNTYIIGGTIIEKEIIDGKQYLYNTCLVLYNGEIVSKYRKINLYKINLKNHKFCEADVLTPGDLPTIVNTLYGKIGIGICYDLRFGELAKYYQENECKIVFYPGSFNRITGPKHWCLLQQARAIDNQIYIVSCSSACTFGSKYESWGKSYVISPWGEIVGETKQDEEDLKEVVINYDLIKTIRTMLPILG